MAGAIHKNLKRYSVKKGGEIMKHTYKVEIVETNSKVVEIEAEIAAEAVEIADDKYQKGDIIVSDGSPDCHSDFIVKAV